MSAPISGTNVLLYSNGQAIALQKGLNFGWDCDLPNATNKESGGWAECIVGLMNAQINFNALYATGNLADNPQVLSGKDLVDYIINSTEILVAILGGAFPIVGKALTSSISLSADNGQPMALTGNLKINGKLYALTGTMAQLLTDPDGEGQAGYDVLTVSGTAISSAQNAAGAASVSSNTFSVTDGDVLKAAFYLSSNSGEIPTIEITKAGGASISNVVQLVAGLNFVTLTITETETGKMRLVNTGACNWSTSPIYIFKD